MTSSDSVVIGAVVLARHGDRYGFYQDPETYTVTATNITPLGEQEEWQLGNLLRSIYLNASSPSYIQGISPIGSTFNVRQVEVYADDSGIDSVIMDSCAAAVQGLWQPTPLENITLANGSTITSPLGGYQYVPINSVDPDTDYTLEGFTDCNTLTQKTTEFYNSTMFKQMASENAAFLQDLVPYVGGRSVQLSNMWNIFDYMNTQSIHNATFLNLLPTGYLEKARILVNWHEYNIFSDPSFTGVGNVAFQTMLPGVIDALDRVANASDPLKLGYYTINYKPLLSMFNMTGVVNSGELPAALVDYAAAVVLEVRQTSGSSEPLIRFQFKNGTAEEDFSTYSMVFDGWDGSGDVPMSTFLSAFGPAAINTTADWCNVCGQTTLRGCSEALAAAADANVHSVHQKITPVGAGFLGAGLTAAVMLMGLGALLLLGVLTLGAGKFSRRSAGQRGTPSGSMVGYHKSRPGDVELAGPPSEVIELSSFESWRFMVADMFFPGKLSGATHEA
ncbi:hypothetical protein POSPLADRAFT_1157245 [Postia placenta MAD-698-R-SB12]|uniref:Phosphoglycerate mutase-like protein n=1 Tax=Postia placenta MAD-698-R-SB12 TaxID=670580 RepID=A0A1X6MLF2_9APHY|nr:hypothetical protein POSPLADRAFT_1157245 [Postia placenta MAD-698-R-SB12]OSX57261.1 hypothetical protein POSPLADRAFT_1157245 [Postia placenta MAD-698-R-SB12]